MLLLSIFQPKKLNNILVLVLAFTAIGNAKTETNETLKVQLDDKETTVVIPEQKSVKKELKVSLPDAAVVVITPAPEKDAHSKKLVIIDENSVIESSGKALVQQTIPKSSEKTGASQTATGKPISLVSQHHQYHEDEDFILSDENDISESVKTGFFFLLILSSAAIVFILFKIYRLRLTRAERKYGVQGDRSTQELTPLPISIEDGHSDEEDQTLFEVNRQNIRIL